MFIFKFSAKFIVLPQHRIAKSCRCHLFTESSFIIFCSVHKMYFYSNCSHSIRAFELFIVVVVCFICWFANTKCDIFNKNAKQALANCNRWRQIHEKYCVLRDAGSHTQSVRNVAQCALDNWKWVFHSCNTKGKEFNTSKLCSKPRRSCGKNETFKPLFCDKFLQFRTSFPSVCVHCSNHM